jgi:RNase P subunit RPR2
MSTARKQRRRHGRNALILCAAVGHTGNVPIPAGTTTGDCSQCKRPVWVSAEARALTRANGLVPVFVCSHCAPIPGVTRR